MRVDATRLERQVLTALLVVIVLLFLLGPAGYGQRRTTPGMTADHVLPSRPENVTWGWIPIDARPALTIQLWRDRPHRHDIASRRDAG